MSAAGELRERIAFDKITSTDSVYGTVAGAWVEQFQCRAGVRCLVGSEPVIAQRLLGVQPVVITVRSSTNTRLVDPSWRIRDANSGVVYQIKACTPDAKRMWIDILASAGVAA